jgi:ATP-binding cassette subfamily B protein
MFNVKNLLGLSDEGHKNFKRAVRAVALSNFCLFLPFMVIIQTIITLLDPLMAGGGAAPDRNRLWLLLALGLAAAVLYFFAYRSEYRKTYTTAYRESEKIRLEVAERIRRLPLSFFNNKDLSELTTNMMADCTAVEHVMSHVAPILFGGIITDLVVCALLAVYDWRMALALLAALPVSLGLVLGSRKLQALWGERHVQAKLAVSGQVQEYLEGIKVVKAFGLSGEKSKALERALRSMMKEAIRFEGFTGVFIVLAMMILQVGIGLVVLTGVFLLTGGSLSVIPFLTFILIGAKIIHPPPLSALKAAIPRKTAPAIITVTAPTGASKAQPKRSPETEKKQQNRQARSIIPRRLLAEAEAAPAGRVSMAITMTMPTKV